MSDARGAVGRALTWLHRLEAGVLTLLVLVLVVLAGGQILLRNLFGGGIAWADPFLRTLVVWTAMLGALAAVREDKHIAVDVLQRFLPPWAQRASRIVTLLFAAAVSAAMAWYSVGFVAIDFGTPGGEGGIPGIPAWCFEVILPIGFGLMAMRFLLRAFVLPDHVPGLAAPELLHAPPVMARDDAGRTP